MVLEKARGLNPKAEPAEVVRAPLMKFPVIHDNCFSISSAYLFLVRHLIIIDDF
jgi:hypothetical protein